MKTHAANRRGHYIIGYSEHFDIQTSSITMENSLYLHVPEATSGPDTIVESLECSSCQSRDVKIYDLNDIRDLQSIVMLLGGKEEHSESSEKTDDSSRLFLKVFLDSTTSSTLTVIYVVCAFRL